MSNDSDDPVIRQFRAKVASDPRLGNASGYMKGFSSVLNDKQPDSEKNTPETEWRRMRDLEVRLNTVGKLLMLMVAELERDGQLNLTIDQKLGAVPEPTSDNYDPISGPAARGGSGGGARGVIDVPAGIRLIREGVADSREVAESALALATDAIPKSLVDAKGDLIVATADNTVARKAVGANNTVLTADSAQTTGTDWKTIATLLLQVLTTKGDLISRSLTGAVRVGVGSDGQVLTSDSTATEGVSWQTGSSLPSVSLASQYTWNGV